MRWLYAIATAAAFNAAAFKPRTVIVSGATGRTGRAVIDALLKDDATTVAALVRNGSKAAAVLPVHSRLKTVVVDVEDAIALGAACEGADAAIWCATGLATDPEKLIDEVGLPVIAKALPKAAKDAPPTVVMLSSAGVTRPSWRSRKQRRLERAYDIPIVRLNPAGILGKKVKAERALAKATSAFCVVRPCGLNDDWPSGRPVFSQGDVAVGRTNREDVATVLVAALDNASARGKTFEMLSLKGYPAPASFDAAFDALGHGTPSSSAVDAQYALLQQLLPGVEQDPTRLEMGRSYEQVDAGEVDRQKGSAPTEREKAVAAGALGN